MKEKAWLKSQVGSDLLDFLAEDRSPSDRKMRLAACACCQRVQRFIGSQDFARLLQLTEKSADDPSRENERVLFRDRLHRAWQGTVSERHFYEATDFACMSFLRAAESSEPHYWNFSSNDNLHYATWSAISARDAIGADERGTDAEAEEAAAQSDLVRDIFGNPFRPVTFDPRWRTSDTVGVAQAIYDEKAFERMPILADALMDAGCEDEQIIGHCRGDGPHVRGCWVVDLILGKE